MLLIFNYIEKTFCDIWTLSFSVNLCSHLENKYGLGMYLIIYFYILYINIIYTILIINLKNVFKKWLLSKCPNVQKSQIFYCGEISLISIHIY